MPRTSTTAAPAPRGPALRRVVRRDRRLRALAAVALTVAAVCAVVLVRATLVSPVRVASGSMTPTLLAGDVVLVDRRHLDVTDVGRGDLVTFHHAETGERSLKRVVGLPGDSVAILDAILHVNDEPVEEPYVDFSEWDGMFTARVVVPEGSVFVLGDNRLTSVDSRDFGPVRAEHLDGRVLLRIWPPVRLGAEDPQSPSP